MAGEEDDKGVLPAITGGSSIVNVRPVFSNDSKYILCCCGAVIRVLSLSSGQCVQELKGHKKPITGLLLNPENLLQVLSCSLDQTIIKWDVADGVLLKRFQTDRPLLALYPFTSPESQSESSPLKLLAVWQTSRETKDVNQLVKFELPRQPSGPLRSELVVDSVPKDTKKIAVGCHGRYITYAEGQTLYVDLLKPDGQRWYTIPKMKDTRASVRARQAAETITCVTCHPSESCIATGMSSGRIICWWGFESKHHKVSRSEYHWHALPVLDLRFSAEGSLLLSGGHECVFGMWQYGSNQRRLLPRLGSPITQIAVSRNSTLYAVCHADNGIQIVASNREIVQHYQGLTRSFLAHQSVNPAPAGLLLDPRSGAVVTNGRPGHLQFFMVDTHKQLYNLDIVSQNYISPDALHQPLAVTEVEKAAFDSSGEWLATVERWHDGINTPEIRLKFWQYDAQRQQYVLNTKVDKPHTQKICSLKIRPRLASSELDDVMAVTASTDTYFKLWSLRDDTDIYRTNVCWKCESQGFYRKQPAGAADFSADGSLLAVAFGKTLTVWDPDTNGLQTTLSPAACVDASEIKEVLFGVGPHWHFLLSTTSDTLITWNLLTCAAQWSVSLTVQVLTPDPFTGCVAAFTDDRSVKVFSPQSSKPVFSMRDVTPNRVLSAVFVPRTNGEMGGETPLPWQKKAQLYYLTAEQELLTLSTETKDDSVVQLQKVAHDVPQTTLSQLMSRRRTRQKSSSEPTVDLEHKSDAFLHQILSTPSHVLPPVGTLCLPFMHSLLSHRPQDKKRDDEDSDAEESSCESEEEMEQGSDKEMDSDNLQLLSADISSSKQDCVTNEGNAKTPSVDKERAFHYKRTTGDTFNWLR